MNVHFVWARSFLLLPLLPLISSARLVSGPDSPIQNFPVRHDEHVISSQQSAAIRGWAGGGHTVGVDDFNLEVHPILKDVRVA